MGRASCALRTLHCSMLFQLKLSILKHPKTFFARGDISSNIKWHSMTSNRILYVTGCSLPATQHTKRTRAAQIVFIGLLYGLNGGPSWKMLLSPSCVNPPFCIAWWSASYLPRTHMHRWRQFLLGLHGPHHCLKNLERRNSERLWC